MKNQARIPSYNFLSVIRALKNDPLVYSAVHYINPKLVIRATWQFKPSGKHTRESMVITFGVPNYLEQIYIKGRKKKGLPLPRNVVARGWPKKRGKK